MMLQVCTTYQKKCIAVFYIQGCFHWLSSTGVTNVVPAGTRLPTRTM